MSTPVRVPKELTPLFEALKLSPDPVFVTDRHNRIVFWNVSAQRILGYGSDEAVGRSCAELLEGCDVYGNRYCSESCPVTQIAVRRETIRHLGLRLLAKDSHVVTVDVSILNFTVSLPDQFFLAHILSPAERIQAESDRGQPSPPSSALISVRSSADARVRKLTPREVEVLGMLAAAHGTPEIASHLHISNLTARNHIQNILDKLEVHSKAEAVALAFQKRLL